jgi:orotate phosphoribosyltransferase
MTGLEAERGLLADLVRELGIVHGRVTLSSGKEADYYVDLRRVTSTTARHPDRQAPAVLTADWEYSAVGGLTLGADPVADAVLHAAATETRRAAGRRVRRPQGGQGARMQRRIEGPDIADRRVLVVETRRRPAPPC